MFRKFGLLSLRRSVGERSSGPSKWALRARTFAVVRGAVSLALVASQTSCSVESRGEEQRISAFAEPSSHASPSAPPIGLASTLVASTAPIGSGVPSTEPFEKALELRGEEREVATPVSTRPEPDFWIGIVGKEVPIRATPKASAQLLGMARMGMLLQRSAASAGSLGCTGGWYAVAPRGYVCASASATLDLEHPVLRLASLEADRSESLPYRYGRSRSPSPAFYTRVPTSAEQREVESDLVSHLPKNFGKLWGDDRLGAAPGPLLRGETLPGRPKETVATGYARARSAFAFLDLFESEGRRFGLTTDFSVIPLDRLEPVRASEFRGVTLSPELGLPLAFVKNSATWVYRRDEQSGALAPVRNARFREAFHLEPERVALGGLRFHQTKAGELLRESDDLVLIRDPERLPKWAQGSNSWLSVSLLRQTLVAFRGDKPVYATLVSTGAGGVGDPEETQATVQGVFRIHTKHVTKTMAGDAEEDPYDLRDVPYVQYFHQGYAFHGAFWHDAFGRPKSHGCINLSPSDARHLFHLTEPPVPSGWHSALSREGTIVWIHP